MLFHPRAQLCQHFGGATSALYETLVVEEKYAVGAGAYYLGSAVDDTRMWVYATPAPGVTLEELDAHKKGMTEVARNARQVSRYLDEMITRWDQAIAAGASPSIEPKFPCPSTSG